MAHEPSPPNHVSPGVETGHASHDAFIVLGLVAVIVGAATGSLAIAAAVFAAPALAFAAAVFLRSHL